MTSIVVLVAGVAAVVDKTPKPADVKAGWTAFAVFVGLCLAVVLLGISLTRHLRKAEDGAAHGVFGETGSTEHPEHTEQR